MLAGKPCLRTQPCYVILHRGAITMASGKSIALAGIAATAIVGVAGAGSSWLISQGDRSNQRALAHDARVYDRRADAYVDALRLLQLMTVRFREFNAAKVGFPGLRPDAAKKLFAEVARGDISAQTSAPGVRICRRTRGVR